MHFPSLPSGDVHLAFALDWFRLRARGGASHLAFCHLPFLSSPPGVFRVIVSILILVCIHGEIFKWFRTLTPLLTVWTFVALQFFFSFWRILQFFFILDIHFFVSAFSWFCGQRWFWVSVKCSAGLDCFRGFLAQRNRIWASPQNMAAPECRLREILISQKIDFP